MSDAVAVLVDECNAYRDCTQCPLYKNYGCINKCMLKIENLYDIDIKEMQNDKRR